MRRLRRACSTALLAAAAAACQTLPAAPGGAGPTIKVEEAESWRGVASPRDATALDSLRTRWDHALVSGRAANLSRYIAADEELLTPDIRLPRAAPAPGTYNCRSIRPGRKRWASSPRGFCYVGVVAGQLSLATELRGLRLGGYLWELKGGERLVFLGASVPAGAKTASAYGDDPTRDMAGQLERIGDFRYRLVLPDSAPSPGGIIIVELTAAPQD